MEVVPVEFFTAFILVVPVYRIDGLAIFFKILTAILNFLVKRDALGGWVVVFLQVELHVLYC